MARRASTAPPIGDRIRDRRNLYGWSIRHAADLAGMSHTTWSRIERGEVSADNRFTIAAIAEALRCSVQELTGLPYVPADEAGTTAQVAMHDVRTALVETDLNDDQAEVAPRPIERLAAETELAYDLRGRCDYAGAAQRLPSLLRELHAASRTADRSQALRLLTGAADVAAFVIRYIGYYGESWLAAERAQQAAVMLGEPVELGLAAYTRAHAAFACSAWQRALAITERGIADLESSRLQVEPALVMLGQLHLTAAYALYGQGDPSAAADRVDAASEIAARTGDTSTLHMSFGPTNVNLWRISMATDGGDPGDAVEVARHTSPGSLPVSRQAAFYLDAARALAQLHRDQEAVRMLVTAERVAPQRIRNSPQARECARWLLERAQRNAVGSQLRGFAERAGIRD